MTEDMSPDLQKFMASLKTILTHQWRGGDLFGNNDATMGMLYLSRMPTDINHNRKIAKQEVASVMSTLDNKKNNDKRESMNSHSDNYQTWLEKRQNFSHSLSTLCGKKDRRAELIQDSALRALVNLSKVLDDHISRDVARSFALLSEEVAARRVLVDETGVVQSLLSLMSSSISQVRIDSAIALCNMASFPGSEVALAREGVAAGLQILLSSSPLSAPVSIRALYNLTASNEGYAKLDEVNMAITTVISARIYESFPNSLSESCKADCVELLTKSLCNLCRIKSNQQRLVETGIVRVIESESRYSSPSNLTVLCQSILHLTQCSRSRPKMVEHRVVPLLLKIQRESSDMTTKIKCLSALYHLAADSACRDKIVSTETLQALSLAIHESCGRATAVDVSPLQHEQDVSMMRICGQIIRVCCNDILQAPRVAGAGIMTALDALTRINDPLSLQYAAESVCCLFRFDISLTRLLHQGAVAVLVRIGECSSDSVTADWCAYSFYHIASNKDCPHELLQGGVLNIMLRMLKDAESSQTKKLCLATLLRLTEHAEISSSSSIPVLVKLLTEGSDDVSKTLCAASLYNLATDDKNCEIMLDCGALLPVVNLIQTDHIATKMQCAAIMSRLSSYQSRLGDIIGEDLVKGLLNLSTIEHIATQRQVVTALLNISKHPSGRPLLRDEKTMDSLISLMSKPDEQIRRGSVAIVVNLTSDVQSEAVVMSIVSTLAVTSTVGTDNTTTRKLCLKSLANLLADESLHEKLVEEGILWVIANLAKIDDPESRKIVATVFCNLSCKYGKQMLASPLVVRETIRLLGETDVQTHLYAARALFNILLISTEKHVRYRLMAVEKLSGIAQSPSNEARELCVLCLCLVSQSDECRPEIVSREILGLIDGEIVLSKIQVSYAYVTMFSNLACWESMRTRLMDENCIARLQQVSESHDASLQMAVARALYCLSCSSENHMSLVQQKSINLVNMIASDTLSNNVELIHLLTAFLYNLTTSAAVQPLIANSSLVSIIRKFWQFFSANVEAIRQATSVKVLPSDPVLLISEAACNLGCGRVNSTRLIHDGIAEILCRVPELFPNNRDICISCSAAMRNLVCVFDNHQILIDSGVINSLLRLSSLKLGKEVLHHCSTAIRTITYNGKFRDELFHNGAIEIILSEDAEGEATRDLTESKHDRDMLGSHNLLRAVEAESWVNKSRGPNAEGRADNMGTTPLFLDFLQGECKIVLHSTTTLAKLEKYTASFIFDSGQSSADSNAKEETACEISMPSLSVLNEIPMDSVSQNRLHVDEENMDEIERVEFTVSEAFEACSLGMDSQATNPSRRHTPALDQKRRQSRRGSLLQSSPLEFQAQASAESASRTASPPHDRPAPRRKKPKYLSPITRMNNLVNVIQSDGSVEAILKEWNAHPKG